MKRNFWHKIIIPFFILAVFAKFCLADAATSGSIVQITGDGNSINPPIFIGDVIAPGDTITKNFTVENITYDDYKIDLFSLVFNLDSQGGKISDSYSEFMHDAHIKIICNDTNAVLFNSDAATLNSNGDKSCEINIAKGGEVAFTATMSLDEAATNAVQGLSLNFDMIIHSSADTDGAAGTSKDSNQTGNPKTASEGIGLFLIGLIAAAGIIVILKVRSKRA